MVESTEDAQAVIEFIRSQDSGALNFQPAGQIQRAGSVFVKQSRAPTHLHSGTVCFYGLPKHNCSAVLSGGSQDAAAGPCAYSSLLDCLATSFVLFQGPNGSGSKIGTQNGPNGILANGKKN